MGELDKTSDLLRHTFTVTLDETDSAWDPSSTKHDVFGPGSITYEQFPDGGVHATIHD